MAKTVTKYSIFVGSPSDLDEERIAIEEVIKELNLTFGAKQNLVLELLKWETHSAPGISNTHPQELINNDIGDEYDIFLGLLWKRFGTQTEKAGSGTEEEFNRAVERFKENTVPLQVLFYFKNAVPKSLKEINASQLLKIEEFKKSIAKDKLLYWEFDSCENLKNFLRLHIPIRINSLIEDSTKINTNTELVEITNDESEYGLLDYSEMFENLMNDSTVSITKIGEDTEWIGGEITKKADEITRISKTPNPNKNVLSGIFKRTAKLLNDYTSRLEIETPIFYSSFEEGIKSGINLINLADDFNSQDTIMELEESKESILSLRSSIPEAIVNMNSFYDSVNSLPRIQKDINIAKKKLLIQLEDLIDKLNKTLNLSEEYSNEIGSKIDKLKITVEK
jgi:hypothetical protein